MVGLWLCAVLLGLCPLTASIAVDTDNCQTLWLQSLESEKLRKCSIHFIQVGTRAIINPWKLDTGGPSIWRLFDPKNHQPRGGFFPHYMGWIGTRDRLIDLGWKLWRKKSSKQLWLGQLHHFFGKKLHQAMIRHMWNEKTLMAWHLRWTQLATCIEQLNRILLYVFFVGPGIVSQQLYSPMGHNLVIAC